MTIEERNRFKLGRTKAGTGLGLFARIAIKKGNPVIEYKGTRIPTTHADTLGTRYLFDLEDGTTIDGSTRSNTARYVNHSCKPNCEANVRDGHIWIDAIRSIKPGDELTFDYGEEYFDEFFKEAGCRCVKCSPALYRDTLSSLEA